VRPASFKGHANGKVTVNQEGQNLHGAREPLVLHGAREPLALHGAREPLALPEDFKWTITYIL
jgi:hypothetical protein